MFILASKTLDQLLSPLTWALVALVALALLHRRPRAVRALAIGALSALVPFSLPPTANLLARLAESGAPNTYDPSRTYDAVVVLGGAYDAGASARSGQVELNDAADRVMRAVELWRAGRAERVLFSGGLVTPRPGLPREAQALTELFERLGVPRERMMVEAESRNTRENALYSARLLKAQRAERILLVTSALHMERALGCFRAVGLEPATLPVDHRASSQWGSLWPRAASLAASVEVLRELTGRLVYRVMGYVAPSTSPRFDRPAPD